MKSRYKLLQNRANRFQCRNFPFNLFQPFLHTDIRLLYILINKYLGDLFEWNPQFPKHEYLLYAPYGKFVVTTIGIFPLHTGEINPIFS